MLYYGKVIMNLTIIKIDSLIASLIQDFYIIIAIIRVYLSAREMDILIK